MERNFNRGNGFRFGNNQRRPFNKEMHDAVCSDCGKECKVPFVPGKDAEGNLRPVYCIDCFKKRKASERAEPSKKSLESKDEESFEEEIEED